MGYEYNTYPQDEGWLLRNSNEDIRLSSLSVHRLTQIFIPDSKPPNCEEAWNTRLSLNGISIDWAEVWSSVGSFLSTPTDEKVWFKLVHRGLRVDGKESINKNCRLCNYSNESQKHVRSCTSRYHLHSLEACVCSHGEGSELARAGDLTSIDVGRRTAGGGSDAPLSGG
eukprot:6197386-Pleurochrysis_carterae.AAC.3